MKAAILLLNYNGKKILDIIMKSLMRLKVIKRLLKDLEIVIIDNSSTDGSIEKIEKYTEKIALEATIIKNKRNLGFTGGMNIGYREVKDNVDYIFVLNNDAIPRPRGFIEMIRFLDKHKNIGAIQGVIYQINRKKIDTAGHIVDEAFFGISIGMGQREIPFKKPILVSYADGAFCGYKIEALEKAGLYDELFPTEAFAYLDDDITSFKIWNAGYKVVSIPTITAYHNRSSTFRKFSKKQIYYMVRGYVTLFLLSDSRFRKILPLFILNKACRYLLRSGNIGALLTLSKAIRDGRQLYKKLNKKRKWEFSVKKIPHIKLTLWKIIRAFYKLRSIRTDFKEFKIK